MCLWIKKIIQLSSSSIFLSFMYYLPSVHTSVVVPGISRNLNAEVWTVRILFSNLFELIKEELEDS